MSNKLYNVFIKRNENDMGYEFFMTAPMRTIGQIFQLHKEATDRVTKELEADGLKSSLLWFNGRCHLGLGVIVKKVEAPSVDKETARALTEAGYMPTSEYIKG